ncbi:MAG: hypothetical protein IKT40_13515 [Bacilli bacterium]|nr:hypothetical protein [Bacilli bacterium]
MKYKESKGKIKFNEQLLSNKSTFEPIFLKFNFTFLNDDFKKIDKAIANKILETCKYISIRPWISVMNDPKKISFEQIPVNQINSKMCRPTEYGSDVKFENSIRKLDNKRDVIRIRETDKGRIIGKIVNKIFYVFYVDASGKGYKHD